MVTSSTSTSPSLCLILAIAGLTLLNKAVILPNSTSLQAAVTAPHFVCPKTKIAFEPATPQAYYIEPKISSLIMFPATLALKISPTPWSKTNSTGTLESIQLSTTA